MGLVKQAPVSLPLLIPALLHGTVFLPGPRCSARKKEDSRGLLEDPTTSSLESRSVSCASFGSPDFSVPVYDFGCPDSKQNDTNGHGNGQALETQRMGHSLYLLNNLSGGNKMLEAAVSMMGPLTCASLGDW